MQTIDVLPNIQKHSQVIVHNWAAKNHTDMIGIRDQQSIIGMGGWDIIKCYDRWIDSQGVNM